MCLYPRLIKNRKYLPNKKNGGLTPPVRDIRTTLVPVGCGNCMECRQKKAREWQVRLTEDLRHNKNAKYITLTFSDESIKELIKEIREKARENETACPSGYEMDNTICRIATRRWLERWRKEHKKSIRHWLVTELGHEGTENVHMHGIIWTDKSLDEIEIAWKYGFMWKGKKERGAIVNYVNDQTVNYIVKYVNKIDEDHKTYKSIILTSSGIGGAYTKRTDSKNNKYKKGETDEGYRLRNGEKTALPIYYRNKIYTDEERENLWIEKLNKEERYVLGVKVTNEQYIDAVKEARLKNARLGYGSNMLSKELEEYENQRRAIMQETRIKKANEKQNSSTWNMEE